MSQALSALSLMLGLAATVRTDPYHGGACVVSCHAVCDMRDCGNPLVSLSAAVYLEGGLVNASQDPGAAHTHSHAGKARVQQPGEVALAGKLLRHDGHLSTTVHKGLHGNTIHLERAQAAATVEDKKGGSVLHEFRVAGPNHCFSSCIFPNPLPLLPTFAAPYTGSSKRRPDEREGQHVELACDVCPTCLLEASRCCDVAACRADDEAEQQHCCPISGGLRARQQLRTLHYCTALNQARQTDTHSPVG